MMSHACHAICTLSPLHAINMQRNSSEVLRLPPKCCACHEKCNSSSEKKKRKNIAPVTQNDFRHFIEHVRIPCLPRKTTLQPLGKPSKMRGFASCLSACLPVCLFGWLACCVSVCGSVCLSVCLFVYLFVCKYRCIELYVRSFTFLHVKPHDMRPR